MNWWREININIKEYAGHYRVIRRSLTNGSSYAKYVKDLNTAKHILKTDDSFREEKGYYSQIEKYEKKVGMFLPIDEEKRKKVLIERNYPFFRNRI